MSIEWLFVTSNHIYKFTDVWAKRKPAWAPRAAPYKGQV